MKRKSSGSAFISNAHCFPNGAIVNEDFIDELSLEACRELVKTLVSGDDGAAVVSRRRAVVNQSKTWKLQFHKHLKYLIADPLAATRGSPSSGFTLFARELVWLAETKADFAWKLSYIALIS